MGGGVCLFQVNIEELVALITDRKGRLCFQKRLSVILSMCVCVGGRLVCINRGSLVRGGGGVCIGGQSVSRGSSYGGGSAYRGGSASRGSAQLPPPTDIWWPPLQRSVRILLECILVCNKNIRMITVTGHFRLCPESASVFNLINT